MKKSFFVIPALLMLLSLPVSAGLIGSVTHDYGIGKFDPGGNDLLTTDSVVVSDQSTERFSDTFPFPAFTGIVTGLELVLDFEGAGPACPLLLCFLGETWDARIQGSQPGSNGDDYFVNLVDEQSPQSILFTSATDDGTIDVWMHSLQQSAVQLWFSELSLGADSFELNSATLNVYGETNTRPDPVPVPEPGSMALLGLGLAGVVTARRRRLPQSTV